MNRSKWLVAVVVVCVLALGLSNAAVAAKKKPTGVDLYKEFCKPCHTEGSEHGEYAPMTLIMDQWTRFFDEKYEKTHSGVQDPNHDNLPVTKVISQEDLEMIKKFAIDGAADGEHPMTCG